MNHLRLPRAIIVLLFILVAGTFLVGTLRSFASARAETVFGEVGLIGSDPRQAPVPSLTSNVNILTPAATFTALPSLVLPSATPVDTAVPTPEPTLAPTDTPPLPPEYFTDMSGIISLAIVLVVVILVGISWGGSSARRKNKKK